MVTADSDRGSDSDWGRVWAMASVQTVAMAGDWEADMDTAGTDVITGMEDVLALDVTVTDHWAGVSAAGDWELLCTTVAIWDIPILITRRAAGAAIIIRSRSR